MATRVLLVTACILSGAGPARGVVKGHAKLRTRVAPVAFFFSARQVAGWLNYEGRLYPFVGAQEP